MKKVAIVDYKLGNLFSVKQVCEKVGFQADITANVETISAADMVILPGVGAFGAAMENLNKSGIIQPLKDFVSIGKPFVGICLGMQLMLSKSNEFGTHSGLGFIAGETRKFPTMDKNSDPFPVPQIQWNQINLSPNLKHKDFFKFLKNESYMYFVHSYYCIPQDEGTIISTTKYAGIEYPSIIQKENCIGIQFHPEKSGVEGIKIYEKLKQLVR